MRILITGGAGFIGSHVVDAYVQAGHEVWVLDDLSRGKRDRVNPRARFVRMDLRSPCLKELLAERSFDCVIHHAAQIDVRTSVADPARDAMVNIVGTLNLLEAMRAVGISRVIFASTGGAIYGNQRHFPASEQHPAAPLSPYGVAKLSVEHYLEYYRQIHALRYIVLRYANVYGPRQDPEGEAGVVAIFGGKILRGERLTIYGDGEQTRDYVFVHDVARANLLALHHLTEVVESAESFASVEADQPIESIASTEKGMRTRSPVNNSMMQQLNGLKRLNGPKRLNSIFNIGTGIETSVNALAATMLEAADTDCRIVHQPPRAGEQARSVIDPSLAKHVLGWEPITPLTEGITQTLALFRSEEAVRNQWAVMGSCND